MRRSRPPDHNQFTQLSADYPAKKQQLVWFRRRLSGRKSENLLDVDPELQGNLLSDLFSWTEIGAKRIGVIQSLLVTCRCRVSPPAPA